MEIALWIVFAVIAGLIAGRKNYGYGMCLLLGLLGVIGVVIAVVLPRQPPKQIGR